MRDSFLGKLHNPDLGVLFIRLALGAVFLYAGWMKVSNMEMTVGFFGQLGIGKALTYVVAYGELLSGAAMVLGLFARYAAVVLTVIMVVAISLVHWKNGWGLANGGAEYTVVLALASLAVLVLGEGRYSLHHLFWGKK